LSDLDDTRLPSGTVIDSDDWFDVLTAVFDPLDARSEVHPWGSTENEYRAMTRGQQAVYNLMWLRDSMESDTFLAYADEPILRDHAGRLVEDAELVGALPFVPTIREIAPLVSGRHGPPYDRALLDEVRRLEKAIFALEEQYDTLWDYLADYVRRTPGEFVRPDGPDSSSPR
jgi:hypothetical protein